MIDNIENPFEIETDISTANAPLTDGATFEYVNAVVLNDQGQALVIEHVATSQQVGKWALLEALITAADDPLTAVQDSLISLTGFKTQRWNYIGTYMKNSDLNQGIGHIFVAQNAKKSHEPQQCAENKMATKWVPLEELRYGLLDGRILSTRYALNVALALLTLNHQNIDLTQPTTVICTPKTE